MIYRERERESFPLHRKITPKKSLKKIPSPPISYIVFRATKKKKTYQKWL